MKTYFKIVFLSMLVSSVVTLTGCQNTVSGFGKDMQQNGSEIQKSVHNN